MVKLQFESNKQYKITLPKSLIEAIGWKKGDRLVITLKEDGLLVMKDGH